MLLRLLVALPGYGLSPATATSGAASLAPYDLPTQDVNSAEDGLRMELGVSSFHLMVLRTAVSYLRDGVERVVA